MANDINVVIGADIRNIQQSLSRIESQSRQTASSIGGSFAGLQSVIVGAFSFDKIGEALNFAVDFDDNLRQTQAAAKLTTEEFEKLKQKALELGREPGQTPALIAAGMAEAARAGQDFNEIMGSVAATARLAASTELDFGEATESTTDILAQFGLTAADNTRLVDVLVAGANSASVKVSQLSESFKFAGALSNSLGFSLENTTAALLVLANSGIKAEQGGTSLRGIWAQMIKHSNTLSESFGVQISTMQNGKTVYRNLADIIDDLRAAGMTTAEVFQVFGKVAGPGAAVLLKQGGDAIRDYEAQLMTAGGTSERVAETMQSGIGGAMRTIASEGQNAVLMLTDEFAPAIKFAAENSYFLTATMEGVVGIIKTAQQVQAEFISSGLSVVSYFGSLTDTLGITENATESLKQASADFGYVAEQAAEKSGESFSKAYDEIVKTKTATDEGKESTEKATESVAGMGESYEEFGQTATRQLALVGDAQGALVDLSEKEIEARIKDVADMYKVIGEGSEEYFANEVEKIDLTIARWEELGASEVALQQYAYDQINDLAKEAYAANDSITGAYLEGITAYYTSASRSITSEQQKIIDKMEELTGVEFYFDDTTDWEAVKQEVKDLEDEAKELEKQEVKLKDETDLSESKKELEDVKEKTDDLDGTEVKISADTSEVASSTGTVVTATNSVESLEDAITSLNNTPTLDPFGNIREGYQQMIDDMRNIDSVASDITDAINSAGADIDPYGELASKYQDKIDQIKGIEKTTADEIADLREEAENEIAEKRLKADEEYQKERLKAEKETIDAQKDYYEEQRDQIKDSLDAAQEALDEAEEQQSAYWDYQLDLAKTYYDDLESERDRVLEAYEAQAEEEYNIALSNYEKKLDLIKQEQSAYDERLSFLKEIYDDSGEAGTEYYRAEADALARKAQEMKNSGISEIFIERWLQDELKDLREKAAEEGVANINSYTNSIISSYKNTGNFSDSMVKAENQMAALQSQIESLKEAGAAAYFDDAAYAAYDFDNRLAGAKSRVESVQESIDIINGDNFEYAGQSADYFSQRVTNASNTVSNLKSQIESVEQAMKNLETQKKNLEQSSGSSGSSGSSSGRRDSGDAGGFLSTEQVRGWSNWTFAGGGYTGNAPRTGGLDGQGGFMAMVHPQETIVDHTVTKSSTIDKSSEMLLNKLDTLISRSQGESTVYIGSINVDKKMTTSELDQLISDINRRNRRG